MNPSVRVATRWALGLLLLSVAAGVYLRALFAWPALRGGLNASHLVHAHSHVAFFGWAVLGVFGAMLRAASRAPGGPGRRRTVVAVALVHVIGVSAVLAFGGFAVRGYDTATITLSALHVLLWLAFAAVLWRPLRHARSGTFHRAALLFLVAAGAATVAPVTMMVRGVTDPWLLQLGVKLFLALFVSGFLLLAMMGIVYADVVRPRFRRPVLALVCAGALPSALLHVAAPAPAAWLVYTGRAGFALLGAATLLFAVDALRMRRKPLVTMAAFMAALAGALQLMAAAGVGAAYMHGRFITVAFLHVLLLGAVTPALLHALRPRLRAPAGTAVFAAGVLVMSGALVAAGWPAAARLLAQHGVGMGMLLGVSLAGGLVAGLGAAMLCVAPERRLPAPRQAAVATSVTRTAAPRSGRATSTNTMGTSSATAS